MVYLSYAFFWNSEPQSIFVFLYLHVCMCGRILLRLFTFQVRFVKKIRWRLSHCRTFSRFHRRTYTAHYVCMRSRWNILYKYMLDLLLFAVVVAVIVVLASHRHMCVTSKVLQVPVCFLSFSRRRRCRQFILLNFPFRIQLKFSSPSD